VPSPKQSGKGEGDDEMDFADEEKVRQYSEMHPVILPRAPYYSQELQSWISGYTSEEYIPVSDKEPPELMHIEGEEEEGEQQRQGQAARSAQQVEEPALSPAQRRKSREQFYRQKMVDSLYWVLDPDNLKPFLGIALVNWLLISLGVWRPDEDPALYLTAYLIKLIQLAIAVYLVLFFTNMLVCVGIGEEELPFVGFSDVWEGLATQFGKFVGGCLLVWWPAILIAIAISSELASRESPQTWDAFISAYSPALVLAGLGAFVWPAIMITMAFSEGVKTTLLNLRPKRLWQLVRTAPFSYLITGLVAVMTSAGVIFSCEAVWLTWWRHQGYETTLKTLALVALGTAVARVYLLSLLMRLTGLYYRHFQDRLEWLEEEGA
jgi:hypothetical protein